MSDSPRPRLDSMSLWRAQQIALRENRSLSNAIATMIAESWNARMAARTRSCYPPDIAERILSAGKPVGAA
jgi:hypothetical protein